MDVDQLFQAWSTGIRENQIAHLRAGACYHSRSRVMGLLVTILSIVVGTSIFTSLTLSQDQTILILVGTVSMVTAIISGANSFLNYSQTSLKHYQAGNKYGTLRRYVDELTCCTPSNLRPSDPQVEKILGKIREGWDTVDSEAPEIAQRFVDEAKKIIAQKRSGDHKTSD